MIAKKMAMAIRGTSQLATVLTLADRLQRRHDYMEKARACRAINENMPSVLEDVCIKFLTAAENDPALADLPFHPGAVRFYRKIGIKIPDALVPTKIGFGAGNFVQP
jgi:hypothetical protein